MAKGCECDVPPIEKRVFSIGFEHGGITETHKKPAHTGARARQNGLLLLSELYTAHHQAKTVLGSQSRLASNDAQGLPQILPHFLSGPGQ
jgi:hypothetical protein